MKNWMYVNKRNEHKFVEIRRYEDGHYVIKQSIRHAFDTYTLVNYTGCTVKQNNHGGVWHRISRRSLQELLVDYELREAV